MEHGKVVIQGCEMIRVQLCVYFRCNEYIFDVYNQYIDHLVVLVGIYLVLSMLFYYHTLGDDSI